MQVSKTYSFKQQCERSDARLREKLGLEKLILPKEETTPLPVFDEDGDEVKCETKFENQVNDEDQNFPKLDEIFEEEEEDDEEIMESIDNHLDDFGASDIDSDDEPLVQSERKKLDIKLEDGCVVNVLEAQEVFDELMLDTIKGIERKIHTCHICTKSFNRSSHLTRHLRVHSGSKPFICMICSKGFMREDLLIRHQIIHTAHIIKQEELDMNIHLGLGDGVSDFNCTYCDKVFLKKESLASHMRTHRNIKRKILSCEICSKQFTKPSQLTRHVKIHASIKPHNCQLCGKGFARGKFHKYYTNWTSFNLVVLGFR